MDFEKYVTILEQLTNLKASLERRLSKLEEPPTSGIDALVELLEHKKEDQKRLDTEHNELEAHRGEPGFDEQKLSDIFLRYCAITDEIDLLEKEIKKFTNQQMIKSAGYEITEDLITEIKDRISIVAMCKQQGIHMRRSGSDKLAIVCPFHDEDTPSCMIYVEQDSWWCFGCNQGGDSLKF